MDTANPLTVEEAAAEMRSSLERLRSQMLAMTDTDFTQFCFDNLNRVPIPGNRESTVRDVMDHLYQVAAKQIEAARHEP